MVEKGSFEAKLRQLKWQIKRVMLANTPCYV
jgi:hypothetical protein